MQLVKVGAAILNQTPLDWDGNTRRILQVIRQARDEDVAILCLPELCISGYGCEDAFLSHGMLDGAWHCLKEILPETRGLVLSLGLPILHSNSLFNAAAMVCDGEVLGFVAKRHLAGDGIHYEPRWFKAWPQGVVSELSADGRSYPLGDLYFNCGGIKIGFEICEDAWVASRPGAALAQRGVDVILNPSASHFAFGKRDIRHRYVTEGSRAFGVVYVYANLVGNEAGRAIYDGGALIASGGQIVAGGTRFSYEETGLTTAVVDIDLNRMNQARTNSYKALLNAEKNTCVVHSFTPQTSQLDLDMPLSLEPWESSPHIKEEEFARAIPLALFDYLRKSRSGGFVLSLSGGADSSACACLVALMVEQAVASLGLEGFRSRLAYLPSLAKLDSIDDFVSALLTCVYQATVNSSEVTRSAARSVAGSIHADFFEWQIDAQVKGYVDLVSQAIGRKLSWARDDLALQNIQARARAPGVWLLANLRNALLLATSNRSEAAVGYATMDGDTCGGLSPIAGIDKHFLRHWLRWMEKEGPKGYHAFPALSSVNQQQPTAELKPRSADQTDEADLMPYDVLDFIERAAIRDRRSPREALQLVQRRFTGYSEEQLIEWVERFFKLWCRNQWKRERYAPSFHLDDENLDPKTWCRFPILSGGYERELEEMKGA